MASLLAVQKAHYAPRRGPPMLLHEEPNPLGRRKRKRRKISRKHVTIPYRSSKDTAVPPNFPASDLPEGFPPELAFRALAAYSLLRTLSCELRLSPFSPNAFLRAIYLPYPNKLVGQIHASLLRILLASLNMGYHCKPKGNNIPDTILKKRRIDGIRWPLKAGDNLTFLDRFSWPVFYDDYVHVTADILWAILNDDENYVDFKNIGMPDLTGMILEEDLREQEEQESLMAPAKMGMLAAHDKHNPFALDSLSRSSRSARRSKASYLTQQDESDEESYEEEAVEEAADNDEDDDYLITSSRSRSRSRKRGLPTRKKASLPSSTPSKVSRKLPTSGKKSLHALKQTPTPTSSTKSAPVNGGRASAKKKNSMLPTSRNRKSASPLSKSPRTLPVQGSTGSPPTKKSKPSPNAGCKVQWVEGPLIELNATDKTKTTVLSGTTAIKLPNAPTTPINAQKTTSLSATQQQLASTNILTTPKDTAAQPRAQVTPQISSNVAVFLSSAPPSGNMEKSQVVANGTKILDKESPQSSFEENSPNLAETTSADNVSTTLPSSLGGTEVPDRPSPQPWRLQVDSSQVVKSEHAINKVEGDPPATVKAEFSMQSSKSDSTTSPVISVAKQEDQILGLQKEDVKVVSTTISDVVPAENDVRMSEVPTSNYESDINRLSQPMPPPARAVTSSAPILSLEEQSQTVKVDNTRESMPINGNADQPSKKIEECSIHLSPAASSASSFLAAAELHGTTENAADVDASAQNSLRTTETNVGGMNASRSTLTAKSVASVYGALNESTRAQEQSGLSKHDASSNPVIDSMILEQSQPEKITPEVEQKDAGFSTIIAGDNGKLHSSDVAPASQPLNRIETIAEGDDQSIKSDASPDGSDFADDEGQWRQFEPVKSMRAGIPYHRLPLEEKLIMLEFLIDELLTVDTFSSEFSKREASSLYSTPYAALPCKEEFDDLENADECAVCRGEGELLCCDGCTSSYHRGCIDMKQNEELPEGRWLCPECELIDPAKFGSLKGGRKSSLDWFTIEDVKTSVRNGKENQRAREAQRMAFSAPHVGGDARVDGNALLQSNNNVAALVNESLVYGVQGVGLQGLSGMANQMALQNSSMGAPSALNTSVINAQLMSAGSIQSKIAALQAQVSANQSMGMPPAGTGNNALFTASATAESGTKPDALGGTTDPTVSAIHQHTSAQGVEPAKDHDTTLGKNADSSDDAVENVTELSTLSSSKTPEDQELLVVHGFVFSRNTGRGIKRPLATVDSDAIDLLGKEKLCEVLKSAGSETSVAWPLAQIPFSSLEPEGVVVKRSPLHPKVLSLEAKGDYDPSQYLSKYRKTPLSKIVFPGSGFQSVQLLLSDYEHSCNRVDMRRISDKLSPNMNGDRILVKALKAELNLFDPYQMIRDYMLKAEGLLNRAHLLNEFWGTLNKDIKVDVWQTNVRKCRSIPRLALLVLKLVDATHRRAFHENWFAIVGGKEADASAGIEKGAEKVLFLQLPDEWTPEAEARKRQWEQSSLCNIRTLLAKEGQDVESWVYGHGGKLGERTLSKRKRKQGYVERLPSSPVKTPAPSRDSQAPLESKASSHVQKTGTGARATEPLAKDPTENATPLAASVHQLQKAIEKRVNVGIQHEVEKIEAEPTHEGGESDNKKQGKQMSSSKSRRSRRSGRLQTKKESPADFLANVIADSGKAQKDLSMETIIEAQKMAKLVEIKELSALPYLSNGAWPVAGRLLFDPVGSISPTEMKRLGRRGGRVIAEGVRYEGSYEVGEVAHFHVWRKNLQRCVSFEQLVLLIRALEANLEKQVVSSCETFARRGASARAQVTKAICCSQKDLSSGTSHHFLVQKNKNRGAWVSSLSVELSPFMVMRSERREKRQGVFLEKLRIKQMARAKAQEAARQEAAARAAVQHRAFLQEQAVARAKAAEEKQKSMMEKAAAKAATKAEKDAAKARAKAERAASKVAKGHAPGAATHFVHQNGGNAMESNAQRVLSAHKSATQKLIRKSSEAGLSQVPEAEMQQTRMHTAAQLQKCFVGFAIKNDVIFQHIGKAEQAALVAETARKNAEQAAIRVAAETEAKRARIDQRLQNMTSGSSNAQQWPQRADQLNRSPQPRSSNYAPQQQQLQHMVQRPTPGRAINNAPMIQQQALHHHVHPNLVPNPMRDTPMRQQHSAGNHIARAPQYNPNASAFNQPQHQNPSFGNPPPQTGHTQASLRNGADTQGIDWNASPSVIQNQLLQAAAQDKSSVQQNLQVRNSRVGGGNSWNTGSSPALAHAHPLAPNTARAHQHQASRNYQEGLGEGSYSGASVPAANHVQNNNANFPQYNNHSMYPGAHAGYQQGPNSPATQGFDLEPTPIEAMAPRPSHNPAQGYPQQHQQQQPPSTQQYQWYQR